MPKQKRSSASLPLKSIWDEDFIKELLPARRHRSKLWNYLIRHPQVPINDLPFHEWSLPSDAVNSIRRDFVRYTTKVVKRFDSSRGDTTKLLVRLQDGTIYSF